MIYALSAFNAHWQETDEARAKPWTALTLTEKINRFRNTLKTSVPNAESLLQAAFDGRGHTHRFDWSNHEYEKQCLCWRQVVGSIQACLPARPAHVFSYSLFTYSFSYIVKNGHQCPRSFKLIEDRVDSFYHPRLGFDFAIQVFGGVGFAGIERLRRFFKSYVGQQQEVFGQPAASAGAPQAISVYAQGSSALLHAPAGDGAAATASGANIQTDAKQGDPNKP